MDRNYVEQHLMVDRYLQGALDKGEQEAFEERLVWDKALVDELDLAEHLRDGLKRAVTIERYTAKPQRISLVAMISSAFAVPQYAAAASFLLAVMLTAAVLLNPSFNLGGSQNTPTHMELIPLDTLRSGAMLTIEIDKAAWTVLQFDVEDDHMTYRAEIRREDESSIPVEKGNWQEPVYLGSYEIGTQDYVSLAIGMSGTELDAGRYILSVEGTQDSGSGIQNYTHIQDIPFEIAAPE